MIALPHFQARRQKLFDHMIDNSIALLSAAPTQHRNSDTEFPYRQESHFHYLTGFDESFAIAVFVKKQGKLKFILFCQDRDESAEQWTGPRAGIKGAIEEYGADEAYPINEASLRFPELFYGMSTIYYLVSTHPAFDKKLFSWINALRTKTRSGIASPYRFMDLRLLLAELRLIKSPDEIEALQTACDISAHGHIQAMKRCRIGMHEYNLEAILLYEFYRKGSRYPAYPSIVASGNRACVLHYTKNNAVLKDNELVLIDAGAEYDYYASDITRTFPINGKFTAEQQAIYELVLASQMAAIEMIAPQLSWDEIQKKIVEVLITGMVDLKILRGDPKVLIEEKAYAPFYMHNSGHWLGMDVHDVGDYRAGDIWRKLLPGMVFTVEPGLYLSESNTKIPEKWRGIGVRIEDDILVTEQGKTVLTHAVPKTVNEIENIMQEGRKEQS